VATELGPPHEPSESGSCGERRNNVVTAFCRLRQNKGYEVCSDEVRVERRGKSSPDGWEQSVAVNSIRSNAVEGHMVGPTVPGRRLERIGNGASR